MRRGTARAERGVTTVLFVPVSGGDGSGEVQRCRLLADALAARHPSVAPWFLLADGAPRVPWPNTRLSASPTRTVPEVVDAMRSLRPALVVFDGNTRVAALDAARESGSRVLLISSRPSARDRGFRWRRMSRLDAHWLVGADLLLEPPGWRERLARWRFGDVDVRRFATLFATPSPRGPLLARLGIAPPYVAACPGGGGHAIDGHSAGDVFGAAADAVAARGHAAVAVGATGAGAALHIDALPNADLMALLEGADAALLGGGSLLVQALALGTPTLVRPLQAEQAARARWLHARGALRIAPASDADALADALLSLARDAGTAATLRARAAALGLRNGLDAAVDALAALAGV